MKRSGLVLGSIYAKRSAYFFFVRLNSFFHIRSDKIFLQCVALLLCTVHGSIDAFRISDIFATRGFADSGSAGEYEQQAGHRYGGSAAFCDCARGRRGGRLHPPAGYGHRGRPPYGRPAGGGGDSDRAEGAHGHESHPLAVIFGPVVFCVFFSRLARFQMLGIFHCVLRLLKCSQFSVTCALQCVIFDFLAYFAPRGLTAEVVICTGEDTRAKGDDQAKVHHIARISQCFRVSGRFPVAMFSVLFLQCLVC